MLGEHTITCEMCGEQETRPSNRARFCLGCARARSNERIRRWSEANPNVYLAHKATTLAKWRKEIPWPNDFDCVDCGRPAECYDHRDYLRPLDVEPVCYSCNRRRGPGLNMSTEQKRSSSGDHG